MPYLGHENFREVEVSALSLQHKASQTTPFRKVFRIIEASVPATTVYPRDNWGSQALYLPIPTTGTARGSIVWTIYADVNGTAGTATEVGSYSVTTGGVVTYTGGIIGAAINGASYTPTANNTVVGIELVVSGLTIGHTHNSIIVCEIYPLVPIEETYGYRTVATAALTAIEGTVL